MTTDRQMNRPVLPVTEPQLKAIYAIARGARGWDDADVEGACRDTYGVLPPALSRRQASEFIDSMRGASDDADRN